MDLKFREVEVPAVAAGTLGIDGYEASFYVRHGCGHEDRCAVTIGKEQMAQLGVAYLEGRAPAAADVRHGIEANVALCAEHMRCRGCLEQGG